MHTLHWWAVEAEDEQEKKLENVRNRSFSRYERLRENAEHRNHRQ